jgi:predicted MFS family arabinose efflux permease
MLLDTPSLDESNTPEAPEISVNRLIFIGLVTRLVTDTAVQIFFPFLPVIAKGWGTNIIAAGRLVSLRSVTGLLSPAFGVMADKRGYRFTMRLGLLLGALGYLLIGLSTNLWLAAVGMVLGGLGTFSFVPTLQAYLSLRLPINRRARGLGTLEYSWALSGIFGLYLVGLLIEAYGWRVPMFGFSGLLMVAFLWYGRLPSARLQKEIKTSTGTTSWQTIRQFFDLGENRRSAWAVLAVATLNMLAAVTIFINYGTWLVREYSLGAAQLGSIALILGVADLGGSILMSFIGDKMGLRRGVLAGTILTIVGYGLLPVFNAGLVLAVIGLIITRFAFEFTVVGVIALVSEQVPSNQGKLMTLAAATALLGATLASFIGPWVYETYDLLGLSIISVSVMLFSYLLVWRFVRNRAEER